MTFVAVANGLIFVLLLLQLPSWGSCSTYNCRLSFQNISAPYGEIVSHDGAGSTTYSNNMRCTWQINAPPGKRIMTWFNYLEVEKVNDPVVMFDGPVGSPIIAVVDTATVPLVMPNYVSTGSVLTVNFVSSASVTMRGFRMMYLLIDNPASRTCGAVSLPTPASPTGSLKSHDSLGTTPYPNSVRCSWTLPGQPGKVTEVSAMFFLADGDCLKLQTAGAMTPDYLSLTYCGWAARNDLKFRTSSDILVEFSSNERLESYGFTISFQYNATTPSSTPMPDLFIMPMPWIERCFVGFSPVALTFAILVPAVVVIGLLIVIGCLLCKNRRQKNQNCSGNCAKNGVLPPEFKTAGEDQPPPYNVARM